jgi:putative transposase
VLLLVTVAGEGVATLRSYRQSAQALVTAQRRVSRRQQGSKRRKQAVRLLAKPQQQGRDFHHTTARQLVRAYATISSGKTCGSPTG